jgi:LysR family cyn operon transcriptional activator
VETHAAALGLAARGTGDTIAPLPLVHQLGLANHLVWTSLEPPLVESLALVARRGSDVSPAVQLLVQRMAKHLARAFSVSIAPIA